MTAFMTACIFVVLAEMGDKTQLPGKQLWQAFLRQLFLTIFLR